MRIVTTSLHFAGLLGRPAHTTLRYSASDGGAVAEVAAAGHAGAPPTESLPRPELIPYGRLRLASPSNEDSFSLLSWNVLLPVS